MAVNPAVARNDYAAANAEKEKLAPGVAAYQPPKVTAAPKVSNPNGAPSFWQRIQADGVMSAKKVAHTTVRGAKDVGGFVKDTAVSTTKQVDNTIASISNTELRHTGSGKLDNAIKEKFGANPVQGFLEKSGKNTPLGVPYSPKAIFNSQSSGQRIASFLGTPNKEQTIGNFFNSALLVGTAGAGKGVELGGKFLIDQLGRQGVHELATQAGIDVTKSTLEDTAEQLAKTRVGGAAIKSISKPADNFVTRAVKTGAKTAPVTAAFGAGGAMSEGGNAKQVAESAGEGAVIGAATGGAASLLKSGVRQVTGRTAETNDIRAQAKTHIAAEKNADEKGLPQGQTAKQIPAGNKTVKQLGAGGKQAEGKGFTVSDKPNPEAIAKSKQIDALQTRITQFQQGKLKITPEEAKSDSAQLKLLKSNAVKTESKVAETAKPQLTSLKAGEKEAPASKVKSKMNESGSANIGQAGADIKDIISKQQEKTKLVKDLDTSEAMKNGKISTIEHKLSDVIKNREPVTNAEKKELQNHIDAKLTGQEAKPLSPKLQQHYADIIEFNKAAIKNDAESARAQGREGAAQAIEARDPETYVPRKPVGKGTSYDYFRQGDKRSPSEVNGLSKTRSSMKGRTLVNATDENGVRHTVAVENKSIKDANGNTVKRINKQVTEFQNGGKTVRSVGSMNLKTNEDRMQKELDPIDRNINNLTKEQKILSATKSRTEAAGSRLSNIEDKLKEAQDDKAAVLHKYDTEEMHGKTFQAKDGHTYTFSQATVDEIQKNTGQRYYVDPHANALMNYFDSAKNLENVRLIDSIKTHPIFKEFSSAPGETAPKGYKSVPELPQLHGYRFAPDVAQGLKNIVKASGNDSELLDTASKFLKQTIVYFPVKHDFNILETYLAGRGLSKMANPLAYHRAASAIGLAIKDVTQHSDFYNTLNEKGFTLVSSNDHALSRAMQPVIRSLFDDDEALNGIARAMGTTKDVLKNGYNKIQNTVVWDVQDIFNIATVRERMMPTLLSKGEDLDTAMAKTQKITLQYKVPTKVLNSVTVSKALKSRPIFFGEYMYNRMNILGNNLKDAVKITDPKGAVEAWDRLAATAAITALWIGGVDKGLQKITGDPNAHASAPGTAGLVEDAYKLSKGQNTPIGTAAGMVSVSPLYTVPLEIYHNTNDYGEPIVNPYSSLKSQGSQILSYLKGQIAPTQKIASLNNATGNKVATWVLSLSGASFPKGSPDLNKYYSLAYNEASPTYDQFRSQVQSGNTKIAIQTADQYNNQLVTSLQKAWEDNNSGKSITTQEVSRYIQGLYNSPWIDTSQSGMYSAKQPSKSILQKIK